MLLPLETPCTLERGSCFPSGRASPGSAVPEGSIVTSETDLEAIEAARQWLSYDPSTGELRWVRPKRKVRVGSIAGSGRPDGYREIRIGARFLSHRLAYMLIHGPIPDGMQVDHVNGDRSDCRIANLRLVSHVGNCENKHKAMSNSKSGLLGASWCKVMKRWVATIKYDGKKHVVGYYDTPEEAHAAYIAERRIHFAHNTL